MDQWYFVKNKNRQGPVAFEVIVAMVSKQELGPEDHVWKKGFETWKKIREVEELQKEGDMPAPALEIPVAPVRVKEVSLRGMGADERSIFIRIGTDRGGAASDYGPFSVKQLKQLYKENRINGKTFVFVQGMDDFKILGDFPEFQELFEEMPPMIKEVDRRGNQRKPFVARLFVQNHKKVHEGICRDISVGGMQVLMGAFTGNAGDSISINVHPENSDYHFTASGVVVRVLEGSSGFSFRFDRLSDEARGSIEKYLKQN